MIQPSETLHEEGDVMFCPGTITLSEGKTRVHITNFSVLTPEQLKNIQPVDPVATWHLLHENDENATQYVSSLLKTHPNGEDMEQFWCLTPSNPGDETSHTPIQKRILSELRTLQEIKHLNPIGQGTIKSTILEQLRLERLHAQRTGI